MKRIKRIVLACLLLLSVLGLSACGSKKAGMDPEKAEQVKANAEDVFMAFATQFTDEQVDEYIEQFEYQQNTVLTNGMNSWKSAKPELGEFISYDDVKVTQTSDGGYKVTATATFSKRKCEYIYACDRMLNKQTELTFNAQYSLKEKLSQAAINLAVGMGTVFVVLIFLTWVISLFKYVNKAQEKIEQKKSSAVITETAAPVKATVPVAPTETSTEIQAVIAAAIAAYEAECGGFEKQPSLNNGIIVRSYKRR